MSRKHTDTAIQAPAKRKSGKVVSLAALQSRVFPTIDLGNTYNEWFGRPGYTFSMFIHGMPGSGKSTLVFNLANHLATYHGMVLFNSCEEGLQDTVKLRSDKLLLPVSKRFHIGERLDFEQFCQRLVDGRYRVGIIDSVQRMDFKGDHFEELKKHRLLKKKAYILISQATASGGIKGDTELIHEVDIKVKTYEGMMQVRSRYLDDVKEIRLFSPKKEVQTQTLFSNGTSH